MEIKTIISDLNKALDIVSRAVSTRTTLPITKGVLIESDGKTATLTGTDTEIGIKTKCELTDGTDGKMVLPASLLSNIVKSLPNNAVVKISAKDGKATLDCESSHFNLVCEPADEFPTLQECSGKGVAIDGETLKKMIEHTCFAASDDEARGVLTGELLRFKDDRFTMVALDGFRMALNYTDIIGEAKDLIIPKRTLSEVARIIGDEDVEIIAGEKNAIIKTDNTVVSTKLLAGDYIDYSAILPKDNDIEVTVDRNDLVDAIKRVLIVTSVIQDKKIIINVSDSLHLSASSEVGNANEEVPITHKGNDLEIAFNGMYLLNSLEAIEDDQITITFKTAVSAVEVAGNGYSHLVLPVRTH